jgi:hypothetical protein
MDKESEAPCVTCRGYSNFVKGDLYMTSHAAQPLKEAIDDWFKADTDGWLDEGSGDLHFDPVEKPKHYMLFEEEGIEVRDVIKKLVGKFDEEAVHMFYSHMFIADYVQMLQYVMRFMDKNGVEDLKKARWYLDKMIEDYESYV